MAGATVFPTDAVISTRLLDSTSILRLLLKSGQSLKSWNKLNIQLGPNILKHVLHIHFHVSRLYNYIKLEHPLIGMVIRKCVFLNFANKDIFC